MQQQLFDTSPVIERRNLSFTISAVILWGPVL